jgi:hypothetical protein
MNVTESTALFKLVEGLTGRGDADPYEAAEALAYLVGRAKKATGAGPAPETVLLDLSSLVSRDQAADVFFPLVMAAGEVANEILNDPGVAK